MEFLEMAAARYSVRDFDARPIEEEKLEKILEAGRLAPTATNAQPQRIIVLKSEEALAKIRAATRMAFNAPVVLMVCYDRTASWKATRFGDTYDAGEMDACIVTTHMMMEATELGIGSLWVRGYRTKDIMDAFELPEDTVLVCLLDLGYPSEKCQPGPHHASRLPLETTVREL